MKFLSDEQLRELLPAETSSFPAPVPTQIVSSDEYLPVPQTEKQREVEARLTGLSDRLARRQGLSRPWTVTPRWRCCRTRRRKFPRTGSFRKSRSSRRASRSTRRPAHGA